MLSTAIAVVAALATIPAAFAAEKKSKSAKADDCPPGMGCAKPVKLGKNGLPEGMADGKPNQAGGCLPGMGCDKGKHQKQMTPQEMTAAGLGTMKEKPQPGLRWQGEKNVKP
jgi:hypothetical protein